MNNTSQHQEPLQTTSDYPACSSKRQLFASKALNLSSKLLTKSANYLSSKDLDSLANPLNRVNGNHRRHSKQRSSELWQEWDKDTCNWNMIVGGNAKRASIQPAASQQRPLTQSPPVNSSNPGYLSYFHPQNWQRKNKESPYNEDHLVCFPGFVALGSPSHSRAGDIELFISIHAFRARSTLDQMNRSQRLVHSMICKMTGLPPLASTSGSTLIESSAENTAALMEQELTGCDEEHDEKMRKFEPLLPSTIQSNPTHQSRPSLTSAREAGASLQPLDTQLASQPAQIICTAPTPIKPNMPTPLPHPATNKALSRNSSTSSTDSYRRMLQNEPSLLKHPHELLDTRMGHLMEKFSIEKEDLHTLHFNLKERLHSFFSQKSESTKVRLKLFGICSSTATAGSIAKSLFRSRTEAPTLLTPELDRDEFIINNGRPLLTQVITTKPGGVWSDKLVLPWQTIETHLRVHQMQQKANSAHNSSSQSPDTGITRLRIEAELIRDESNDSFPRGPEPMASDPSKKDIQLRKLSVGKSSLVMELDVIPALAESVHVISDIDDTIKHTNVLGGLKAVFKNVFLAGFDQVSIPGMAEWYQSLQELGCWMHYISNSPMELWYCIEGFLAANGFPRGSISLKEYARGATSILSGMWESAGARKRARVESIINRFPNSKFICVGDSGEQDLEMYVSLAQAYPGRIMSIYIRDVTTPVILGKDISIDQLSTADRPLSDWEDLMMRPPTQIKANILSPSRSSSPSRQSFAMPVNLPENNPLRSKSVDVLSNSNNIVAGPSKKRNSHRPIAPPKPLHLSSKPAGSRAVADISKRMSHVEQSLNQTHAHLCDPSIKSSRSASIDITPSSSRESHIGFDKEYASSMAPICTTKSSYQPTPSSADDIKTQSLLDGFRNRIKKPSYDRSGDQDRQKFQVSFPNTKLKLFRSGFDECVAESIRDVKKVLNK
ncbi:hypothetical protein PtA15_16A425 [Puccinia triticina]|uniref:Phosphatidate phosphatase APP1 catalytic domain-containing protein n=1 Tax=Puccinia triticina TaxID=208348 RepID=A0ABY7D841_9BASI|nr:uncharacterized protein PtA15_16A425 [Puccinia triticina]WAQ92516.1 hypothetical protein PtA15_16A425 [Puccinia triticina]